MIKNSFKKNQNYGIIETMKNIAVIFIIIFFAFTAVAAENSDKSKPLYNDTVSDNKTNKPKPKAAAATVKKDAKKANIPADMKFEDVFPNASELDGGPSAWIASEISKTEGERYILYEKNYTYYSTKKEKIWDIERNSSYSVSARIFSCENLEIAAAKYENLVAVDKKIKSKKMSAPAPFGEKALLLALPGQGKGQQADYYMTFLFRTFVVQVYSDDGFAQIDMASDLEKRLAAYLKAKGIDFYMNKINLEISFGDVKYREQVHFKGDDISVVVLSGKIFDAGNKPVKDAKVFIRETAQETKTDETGKYSIEVTSGWGKAIYLSKMIFIPTASQQANPLRSGIYPLKVKNGLLTVMEGSLDIFIAGDKIIGKFLNSVTGVVLPIAGSIQGNTVLFAINNPSLPSGRQVFKGEIRDNGIVNGTLAGGGKSGKWQLDPSEVSIFQEKKYLRDIGITAINFNIQQGLNKGKINTVKLKFKPDTIKNLFYFKQGRLILKKIDENQTVASFSLCEIDSTGKEVESFCENNPKNMIIQPDNQGNTLNIDISSYLRNANDKDYVLIGKDNNGDYINFKADIEHSFAELYYYDSKFIDEALPVIAGELKSLKGDDIVSNANLIKSDGEDDIVLSLKVSLHGRIIESVEVKGMDAILERRWNTNPFDIYPVIGIVKDGNIINSQDGSINFMLENETEYFDINIYRGSFAESGKGAFKIKCVIDGKTYESGEINF